MIKKIIKNIRMFFRWKLITSKWRKYLKHNITIFSSDCTGGVLYHDLKYEFISPTINMYFSASDFLKFIKNPSQYITVKMIDVTSETDLWPVALLNDIHLQLVHYKSVAEAQKKWDDRVSRIDWNNVFFIMNDRNGCTYEDILEFDKLNTKRKVIFTHIPYKNIDSAYYLKGFEKQPYVGVVSAFNKRHILSRTYDSFDWCKWFNE